MRSCSNLTFIPIKETPLLFLLRNEELTKKHVISGRLFLKNTQAQCFWRNILKQERNKWNYAEGNAITHVTAEANETSWWRPNEGWRGTQIAIGARNSLLFSWRYLVSAALNYLLFLNCFFVAVGTSLTVQSLRLRPNNGISRYERCFCFLVVMSFKLYCIFFLLRAKYQQ